jgi:hypothetical protein
LPKTVKRDAWTKDESFAAAKRLKKVFPRVQFQTCTHCGTYCVVRKGVRLHPLCAEELEQQTKKMDKKAPDPNQGRLVF